MLIPKMEISLCDNNERFTFSVCLFMGHTFLFFSIAGEIVMAQEPILADLIKKFEKQEANYWAKTKGFRPGIENSPDIKTEDMIRALKKAREVLE